MQQKQPHEPAENLLAPHILKELEDVLRKLQERIIKAGSPTNKFALIYLVDNLGIEEWRRFADEQQLRDWLALPLDPSADMPLSALRDTLEELIRQRDIDALTGIANRRLFTRSLSLEVQRAARTGMPLSLVMIDLDNFKDVNDRHGHSAGDAVLAELGSLLSRSVRPYDRAARIGGEEFCLLLPGASMRQAEDLAVRILEEFRDIAFEAPGGNVFTVAFSAGVATSVSRKTQIDAKELFAEADQLLYEAKRLGKNRVVTAQSKHVLSENPALVRAEEKQFLFTGKHA